MILRVVGIATRSGPARFAGIALERHRSSVVAATNRLCQPRVTPARHPSETRQGQRIGLVPKRRHWGVLVCAALCGAEAGMTKAEPRSDAPGRVIGPRSMPMWNSWMTSTAAIGQLVRSPESSGVVHQRPHVRTRSRRDMAPFRHHARGAGRRPPEREREYCAAQAQYGASTSQSTAEGPERDPTRPAADDAGS